MEVDLAPARRAGRALAEASYFARDLGTFRNAAERAMALNPIETRATVAFMGVLISVSAATGTAAVAMVAACRCRARTRHHPGWYHGSPSSTTQYRKRELRPGRSETTTQNQPARSFFCTHVAIAAGVRPAWAGARGGPRRPARRSGASGPTTALELRADPGDLDPGHGRSSSG